MIQEEKNTEKNPQLSVEQVKPSSNIENLDDRIVDSHNADATLKFMKKYDRDIPTISSTQEAVLSRKVYWIIFFWTFIVCLVLYMDKATLSYASILGLWEDTHVGQNEYNNVNTLFYVGFVVGQIPGTYLVQRLPLSKFLTFMLFSWTLLTFLTCCAKSYGGLIALRFFLGLTEAEAIPSLMMTMAMFLDNEQLSSIRPIFYASCMGSPIPIGFIAYGCLHTSASIHAWRILMIIIGGIALILTVAVYFYYPDNPTNAKFLTLEEKVWTIRRVQKSSHASIEQKVFKKYQFIEALKDPLTWAFALFFLFNQLANNLGYQENLLFIGIGGVSNLGSTLVSVAGGGFNVVCAIIATVTINYVPGYSAWSALFWSLPPLAGSIALVSMPWSEKLAMLACILLASTFAIPWVIAFGWASSSCSGHTKRVTRNGIISASYAISNIISPQLWQAKDAPRYVPAWIVQIVLSFFTAPLILVAIWFILRRRNSQRLEFIKENSQILYGVVEDSSSDNENVIGASRQQVVDIANLDLTDWENKAFVYPL